MRYHVVVDLEMCKIPKGFRTREYHWSEETIQIGAVLLDDDYNIIDKFNTYVSPRMGRLDSFITRLTGIKVEDVIDAPDMEEALNMFTEWIPKEDVEIVSWSETDQKQIQHEMEGKMIENVRMTELLENWNDCQKTFSIKMNNVRRYSLSEALIATGIYPEGQEHDGYYDAYNTALLFKKIETEDELQLCAEYKNARSEEKEELTFSLGDLFKNLDIQLCAG